MKVHFLSLLLILFYLSEGYNKFYFFYFDDRVDIVRMIKLGIMLYVSIDLLKKSRVLHHIFILIFCFCIGQLSITPNFDYTILSSVLKYIFPLLLFAYFNNNRLNIDAKKSLQKAFESLIVFNSVLILFGFLFEINVFKTYLGSRFGFNGLLVSSATATYVIIIALFYFLYKKESSFIFDFKVLLIIISSTLIGTKSIYLALGLISILYFLLYTQKRQKFFGITVVLFMLISVSYYAIHYWEKFNFIWKNEGLLTSILSYRDVLLTDQTLPFITNNWTAMNYLFGGVNDITTRPQMGFIDLFYFFGVLGSLYYLYLYITNYIKYKFMQKSLLFLCFISIVIAITGNFFLNSSVVIYMLIIRELNFNSILSNRTNNK